MNKKKCGVILIAFSLSMLTPKIHSAQQAPACNNSCTITQGEDVLTIMAENCPQALETTAREIYEHNPTITWQELLDLYTVKHDNNRLLGKALKPMVQAIWKKICEFRQDIFRNLLHAKGCSYIQLPQVLSQAICTAKNTPDSQKLNSPVRAIVIVDKDLKEDEYSLELEACNRCTAIAKGVACLLGVESNSHETRNFGHYLPKFCTISNEPKSVVNLLDLDRGERHSLMKERWYFEELEKLINSQHFVMITTPDNKIFDKMINKSGIIVINLHRPTMQERLITLYDLARQFNCPAEIINNLHMINQIIPQGLPINNDWETFFPVLYKELKGIMQKAVDIFLMDGKLDLEKAQTFFKGGLWHWNIL